MEFSYTCYLNNIRVMLYYNVCKIMNTYISLDSLGSHFKGAEIRLRGSDYTQLKLQDPILKEGNDIRVPSLLT